MPLSASAGTIGRVPPERVRMGPVSYTHLTLPIMPALQDRGIPTILTGFALPESNVHSPNERMLVEFFPRGVKTIRELYRRLGDLS